MGLDSNQITNEILLRRIFGGFFSQRKVSGSLLHLHERARDGCILINSKQLTTRTYHVDIYISTHR